MSKSGKPVALIVVAVLLFLAALCELITAGVVQHRLGVAINEYKDDLYGGQVYGGTPPILLIPYSLPGKYFSYTFSEGELAAGALSIINVIVVLAYAVSHSRAPQGRSRGVSDGFKTFVILVLIVTLFTVTGLFAWIFAVSDSANAPTFSLTSELTANGTLYSWEWFVSRRTTWEKWTCAAGELEGGWLVPTCKWQRASRYTMIPLFVLSFASFVLFLMAYPPDFWVEGMNPPKPGQQPAGAERVSEGDLEKDREMA